MRESMHFPIKCLLVTGEGGGGGESGDGDLISGASATYTLTRRITYK